MAAIPIPQTPQYRITLFYGPDPVEGMPPRLSCVFNVKKRSWKSGIQVAVELTEEQLTRARQAVGLEPWLTEILATLPEDERGNYESRARDVFVQGLCSLKLHLAIEAGLPQESRSLTVDELVPDLDGAVSKQADQLQSQILSELDLTV